MTPARLPDARIVRFALAGLFVTALSALIYLYLASIAATPPLLANIVSHAIGVVVGYALHSRWTFQATTTASLARFTGFAGVSLFVLALNSAWVWLATVMLGGPAWCAVLPMVFVTPLVSFLCNDRLVFAKP